MVLRIIWRFGTYINNDSIYCLESLPKPVVFHDKKLNFGDIVLKSHLSLSISHHDDGIEWKHFPRYWPFVRGIIWSAVNSPHTGLWRGALLFSLIFAWINVWGNKCEPGDLRRHRAHHDVTVMLVAWQPIVVFEFFVKCADLATLFTGNPQR